MDARGLTRSDVRLRVRCLRESLGLTQGELAEELGVTLLTIHRWEAGKAAPDRGSLQRLGELEERITAAARTSSRTMALGPPPLDFAGNPHAISAFAEALCLAHGHEFNPAFAIETARIDPLPHQRIAVYERLLTQDPLRFLLADDAGAGKSASATCSPRRCRDAPDREAASRGWAGPPATSCSSPPPRTWGGTCGRTSAGRRSDPGSLPTWVCTR